IRDTLRGEHGRGPEGCPHRPAGSTPRRRRTKRRLSAPDRKCWKCGKRFRSARFVKSAKQANDFPKDRKPEIAFCGRSNSGKSSLLNALTKSQGLARTSASPGRTQLINFFLVDGQTYYVDLPGYGYAKVPRGIRDTWGEMIEGYLRNREPLKLAIMLVDSRIPPTD